MMNLLALICVMCGLYSTSNAMTLEDLKKEHVIISGPVNVKIYYISATDIVVGWDMRQVYIPHNVGPHNFTKLKQGQEIAVSKPHIPLVATNTSQINETATAAPGDKKDTDAAAVTDESNDNKGNQTDSSSSTADGEVAKTEVPARKRRAGDDASGKQQGGGGDDDQSKEDSQPRPWVCKPATDFTGYTVAIKENPGPDDNSWATQLINATENIPLAKLTLKYDNKTQQKMVAFELGCVTKFRVVYKPRFLNVPAKSVEVEHYHRAANISGLKELTTYGITVEAVYVNDVVLSAKPVYAVTKKVEDKPECACDWHGTVNLRNSCQIQPDGKLCQCRPEYQGEFCEECAAGYFRTAPYFPCNRCPCAEHSSVKSSCRFEQGFLYCDKCEVGYSGNICHMCAKGFYRHGKFCVSCGCNGNSDPNQKNMCKPETGECLNCIKNTTGFHCDRCLPGYEGSPVTYRNCTLKNDLVGGGKAGGSSASSASSGPSMGVIAALVVGALLILALVVGLVMYKRLRARQQRRAFWTVELRRDKDSTEFNSVHNDEAHLDDVDDLEFYEHQGGTTTTSGNKYSRLNEQI